MNLTISIEPVSVPLRLESSGTVRVGQTRVTLDSLVATYESGSTPEEIQEQFPTLVLADIYWVIGYYLAHRSEVDAYLASRRAQADEIKRQYEELHDPTGIKERLLARMAVKG